MGFLSDIRKLLFGAKAVAKSGAEKAGDFAKSKGETVVNTSGEILDRAKDSAEALGSKTMDQAEELFEKAKDAAENVGEKIWDKTEDLFDFSDSNDEKTQSTEVDELEDELFQSAESMEAPPFTEPESDPLQKDRSIVENVGDKVLDTGEEVMDKAKHLAENVGDKVLDAGEELMEKAKKLSENIGDKVKDKGGDVMDTFKGAAKKAGDKFQDFFEEAQEAAANETKQNPADIVDQAARETGKTTMDEMVKKADDLQSDLQDKLDQTPKDLSGKIGYGDRNESLLDGKDSFFNKAKRFADGDYHNEGDKPRIITNPKKDLPPLELPAEDKSDPNKAIHGFTDEDGDGNPLVDDAIIDEDPED